MSHIVLTLDQLRVLGQAREPVEVRDDHGNVLAHLLSLEDAADVAESRRRLASNGPRYSMSQIQERLKKLDEISQRETLDSTKVHDYLRRMRAGEET